MNERGKQNLAYADNPNVRKYLDMIRKAEGSKGYEYGFNNVKLANLSDHPGTAHSFKETDGNKNTTTAAGAYQFLNKTWGGLKGKLALKDFSAQSQDAGAVELLRGRGALDAVIAGDWTTALAKTGAEWASLPTSPYKQPKRSMEFVYGALGATKPEGAVYKEFFKNKNEVPQPVDSTTPWLAASAPPPVDWQTNLVQEAQMEESTRNRQQMLHGMFADANTPQPKDEISLPPALRKALDDIIKSV